MDRRKAIRRTQAERSEETREKLCRAALDAMTDVGYGRFATDDVARRANVSRGALTHQFPSRNHLIIAAYDYLLTSWERDWANDTIHAGHMTPVELTDLLWTKLFHSTQYVASLEIMLAARKDDELGNGIRAIMVRWTEHRDKLTAHLLGASPSDEKVKHFVQLTLCVLRGIALHHNFSTDGGAGLQDKLLADWKALVAGQFKFPAGR
nr:TetR/AcrR family transcriptional regulator [Bosea sp. (in: a-proteobacteria)]